MRVFVTGASGWLGSAVVPELLGAGHQVVGLARSDESAKAIRAAGAEVQLGGLDDLDILKAAAASSDGVIHLAFKHELAFTGDFGGAASADRAAVDAMCDALAGSDKPFVLASGLLGLKTGEVATENDGLEPLPEGAVLNPGPEVRQATAKHVLSLANEGIRTSIMRLAPTNHGDGDNGFMKTIVDTARDKGIAGYIGDGSNRWPAIHRLDSANLFRLALESAPAGTAVHACAEEGVRIKDVAEVIGKHLNIPVESIDADKAFEHFGWMGAFIGWDAPASSEATQKLLSWNPVQVGLIEDLDMGHYFK